MLIYQVYNRRFSPVAARWAKEPRPPLGFCDCHFLHVWNYASYVLREIPLVVLQTLLHPERVSTAKLLISLEIDAQGHFGYNAAKGATVHLSKLMSFEFKKAGIRVNSIAYVTFSEPKVHV